MNFLFRISLFLSLAKVWQHIKVFFYSYLLFHTYFSGFFVFRDILATFRCVPLAMVPRRVLASLRNGGNETLGDVPFIWRSGRVNATRAFFSETLRENGKTLVKERQRWDLSSVPPSPSTHVLVDIWKSILVNIFYVICCFYISVCCYWCCLVTNLLFQRNCNQC